ncbi:MAG: serine/threonine protein kinase [Alphaproteobacteria bacterium]|nr:serine/threonine protein kinase [Alphaproteobacteria bacterium]
MAGRRFEILEIPGGGAHATVCLARDITRPGSAPVALKVLKTEYEASSSEAKRARDEGVLLQALDHPNIVRVVASHRIADRQVLVMEWVEGPPIVAVVRKLGRLPVPVALEILRQIAGAVQYAFHFELRGKPLNLVHRDLNLSNVLISIRGAVKILDYGLAKAEFDGREADTLVSLRGTAGYMPPEGVHGHPSQDVYALGICLFYMLTGHLPILSRQRMAHDEGLAEQLAWMDKELTRAGDDPAPLRKLIRSMCGWDPYKRPTIDELVAELENLLPEPTDLVAWADANVHPIHVGRRRVEPREHLSWDELEFLEGEDEDEIAPTDEVDDDALLRAMLADPTWHTRQADLKRFLSAHPKWTAAPLLEYLAPLRKPWWHVLAKRPANEASRTALRILAHRRTEAVIAFATGLRRHRDPTIRELARAIVEGRDVTLGAS